MKLLKRFLAGTLSLALVLSLTVPVTLAEENTAGGDASASAAEEKSVLGTVTGFGELEEKEITMAERLSLGEILDRLPETLGVYLDGSSELTQIPVSWYCPGGYEDSNDYYFQFSPTWDEDSYPLAQGLDVELDAPYVGVFLADLNALGSLPSQPEGDSVKRSVAPGSADEIFAALTSELGMNSAAACGILANMHAESALNPRDSCKDINGKTSYGLCQWNGSRFTRLREWCKENNEDYTTVTGQLHFLAYELPSSYPKVYNHMLAVEDTEEGAYDAAYYWCYYYEMPASRGKRSKERGNLARDKYWPNYGGTAVELDELPEPVLTGVTTPEISVPEGQVFHLAGTVQCSKVLEQVDVWVWNAQNKKATGKTVKPGSRIFSISSVDSDVKFSKLKPGDYVYRISAQAGGKSYSLLEHPFTVTGKGGESAPRQEETEQQEGAPTLTGVSKPAEEHSQGEAITVRGKVKSSVKLERVQAWVLREDGSRATGGSAKVKSKSYNLNRLDNKVGFSKLGPGRYTYEITAQAGGKSYTLLHFPFVVMPRAPKSAWMNRYTRAVRVKWHAVSGADGYEVQWGTNAKLKGADVVTVTGGRSKKFSGLVSGTTYYARVRSYVLRQNGQRSYSAFTKIVSKRAK